MGGDKEIIEIVILAMVAGFILLRLRSVLGKRRQDEPPAPATPDRYTQPNAVPGTFPAQGKQPNSGALEESENLKSLSETKRAIVRKIFGNQGQPGLDQFIEGAKRAYGSTLKGFWAGDMKEMEPFVDRAVLEDFKTAIKAREEKGEHVENRLVEIVNVDVKDAEIQNITAEITLRFESEIVAVLRDKYGKLLEGNLSDTVRVNDVWTFARNLKSRDPNWILVETQAG